jgi:hypothetical protein
MTKYSKYIFLMLFAANAFAGCDPTLFRWGCSLKSQVVPKKTQDVLIYCGDTRLYVSQNQFHMIKRYQRAGITMSLLVDDIFYDGPCLPAKHNINHHRPTKV